MQIAWTLELYSVLTHIYMYATAIAQCHFSKISPLCDLSRYKFGSIRFIIYLFVVSCVTERKLWIYMFHTWKNGYDISYEQANDKPDRSIPKWGNWINRPLNQWPETSAGRFKVATRLQHLTMCYECENEQLQANVKDIDEFVYMAARVLNRCLIWFRLTPYQP